MAIIFFHASACFFSDSQIDLASSFVGEYQLGLLGKLNNTMSFQVLLSKTFSILIISIHQSLKVL
jgi:hypothetical protein